MNSRCDCRPAFLTVGFEPKTCSVDDMAVLRPELGPAVDPGVVWWWGGARRSFLPHPPRCAAPQTSREPGSRRPDANTLYDVFCNIRDDEGEHVKTMSACQGPCVVEWESGEERITGLQGACLAGAAIGASERRALSATPCRLEDDRQLAQHRGGDRPRHCRSRRRERRGRERRPHHRPLCRNQGNCGRGRGGGRGGPLRRVLAPGFPRLPASDSGKPTAMLPTKVRLLQSSLVDIPICFTCRRHGRTCCERRRRPAVSGRGATSSGTSTAYACSQSRPPAGGGRGCDVQRRTPMLLLAQRCCFGILVFFLLLYISNSLGIAAAEVAFLVFIERSVVVDGWWHGGGRRMLVGGGGAARQ